MWGVKNGLEWFLRETEYRIVKFLRGVERNLRCIRWDIKWGARGVEWGLGGSYALGQVEDFYTTERGLSSKHPGGLGLAVLSLK